MKEPKVIAQINEMSDQLSNFGEDITKHGAQGDTIVGNSDVIQRVIDEFRDKVIESGFTSDSTILIPAGRYKIDKQIILSPFLKLKAVGRVIFETYVANDSALWITPQLHDPGWATLEVINRQQWFRSPLINGTDGGFVFVNKLSRSTSKSTAIEFGSREDLGIYKPLARYAVVDVAVEQYDVGFKMNIYHHYIGSFERIHLELTNTLVLYGNPDEIVENSGENFHFSDSIFAGAFTAFKWNCDGFDTHFTNCSFDFVRTVFHVSRGYKGVTVTGGHIEGIQEYILLEDSVHPHDAGTSMSVSLTGTTCLIPKRTLFKTTSKVQLRLNGLDYRQWNNASSSNYFNSCFLVSEATVLKSVDITFQGRGIIPQINLTKTIDPFLKLATLGGLTTTNSLPYYKHTMSAVQVTVAPVNTLGEGYRCLNITGFDGSGTPSFSLRTEQMKVDSAKTLIANFAIKSSKAPDIGLRIRCDHYRLDGSLIKRDDSNMRWLGNLGDKTDDWYYPDQFAKFQTPIGTDHCIIEYTVSGNILIGATVSVTGFFAATF